MGIISQSSLKICIKMKRPAFVVFLYMITALAVAKLFKGEGIFVFVFLSVIISGILAIKRRKIFYAFILGYLFVIIFIKSDSIIPTIIAHSFINAIAIFNINNTFSFYIVPLIIIIIAMIYSEYLRRKC